MPLNRHFIQNLVRQSQNPQFPLKLILIAPFVIQITIAVGVTGYISLQNGQKAVNAVAKQLRDELTTRIERELLHYLVTAQTVNQINVNGLESETLDANHLVSLETYLDRQLRQFKEITSITIASEAPDYIGLGYNGDDRSSLYVSIWNKAEKGTFDWLVNSQGQRQLLGKDLTYDHRNRPWYRDTLKANQPIWNDVYVTITPADLVISASQPFYGKQGKPLGVVSSDLALAAFSRYLRGLKIGQTGQAFILERNGLLVATSTDQQLFKIASPEAEPERVRAIDSSNHLVSTTTQYLINHFDGLSQINQREQADFTADRERLFVQVLPFQQMPGLDWLVVVVVPEADFMAQINANTMTTAWLCMGALISAIGLGILTTRWISQPILRLYQASRSIAEGDLDQRIDDRIPVIELAAMAQSFNQMADQMGQALQQIEEALSESEEKFIKVFRFGPDPIAITTFGEGKFITVNDSFLDWYGFSRHEVIGYTCQELYLWPNLEDYRTLVRLLQQKNLVRNLEVMHRTKSGEVRTILLSAEIASLNGQTCVISSIKNISERKQVEAELRQAKEAADAANRAKSEFLTNMSHELRTPLNAILGFSDMMRGDRSLFQEQRENLNIIHHSGEYLLGLINDVLDLSRIEAGKTLLQEAAFDLHDLLTSLEAMMRLKAESKGLELVFHIDTNVPRTIYADESKLRQVLINLLGNATKFTDAGSVILHVKQVDNAWPERGQSDKHKEQPVSHLLQIEVEDTGPGISDAELKTLFQPFTQAEAGKLKQGTGLGLSISRKLIQLMGGTITVSSRLGQGSIFQIVLPIKPVHITPDLKHQTPQQVIGIMPSQPAFRLLVVDDVCANRLLLIKSLVPIGFEVLEAENGQQAIALWQEHQPHLIFMDMRMPVMDGYDATRQIKATPQGKAIAIIAVTASAMEEHQTLALAAGCDDFIAKPVKKEVLLAKIATYLPLKYLYEMTAPESSIWQRDAAWTEHPISFYQETLAAIMPCDWRSALHFAALSCDVKMVEQLITQIPETHPSLARYLQDLAHNFRFDRICELSQESGLK